ncbi:SgcJ/EcaC family oxidoreductase [Nocardia goodfellowii]|uniref:Limonene-1,2-epoxide hydrolase n=1 Tax=Nocardia goodfellowii TaxID=882446 RepID=A0ABS4QE99_9NOCA|nr:SgcJ/EcaC family oxidoreductase [Nocardia goodfellowii]MBP2190019.1 limonene-1,2-epoxide hydrolase [Nocardia goodfellowii]
MTSPDDLVRAMCQAWSDPDPAAIAEYFAEDAVYHNIPMEPVVGRAAITEFVTSMLVPFTGIDFDIHLQVSNGATVMNERTDTLRGRDGRDTPLPVVGVFEVHDGLITAWRDYFDMAAITRAFGG